MTCRRTNYEAGDEQLTEIRLNAADVIARVECGGIYPRLTGGDGCRRGTLRSINSTGLQVSLCVCANIKL